MNSMHLCEYEVNGKIMTVTEELKKGNSQRESGQGSKGRLNEIERIRVIQS